jgi:hypothetical protein
MLAPKLLKGVLMATVTRDDLSDSLVHLTKGTGEEAFTTFVKILNYRALLGGTGYIKGSYACVCFSEAPISKLSQILSTPHDAIRYRPYGLLFKKSWIYSRGGLPVIYQPDTDYDALPENKKHLHVRFQLGDYIVDHTWEREWRVKTKRLEFSPDDVTLVVPTRIVSNALKEQWLSEHSKELKRDANLDIKPYPWHHIVLGDLGIEVPDYL